MSDSEVDAKHEEKPLSNLEKAKLIEKLLIGPEADLFSELEQRMSKFCPFEAIGMVRQEIRHAHFLSFILDPNRPHSFRDDFLKAFLQEIVIQAQDGQSNLQPLQIHCADFTSAMIYRERANIDLLVEVPPGFSRALDKGLIVTIELKVDAVESKHQLTKYREHVRVEYPEKDWEHVFAFLTIDAVQPTEANLDHWIPVSITDLVERFDLLVEEKKLVGEAVELYRKYSAMMRRHLMEDAELTELAKSIWAKHREALEALYDYWPDLQADIMNWLKDNSDTLRKSVKGSTNFSISPDTSSPRLLRYSVDDWQDLPGFNSGDTSWVDTASLIVLELADWGDGRIRFSIVLGPGDTDLREQIYQEVLRQVDNGRIKIGRRTSKLGRYKHLSGIDVQSSKAYQKAEVGEASAEELGRKVMKRVVNFLELNLQVYDEALRKVLEG